MKYKNTDNKYLKNLNDAATETKYFSDDPIHSIIPQANNKSNVLSMYLNRLNYEIQFDRVLPILDIKPENFKDFSYTNQLYGKINTHTDVVNVDEQQLLPLTAKQTMKLVAPAADAFNRLFLQHKKLLDKGAIPSDSVFSDITPQKSFISANLQHSEYLNRFFNNFYSFINDRDVNKKIIDFKSFIKYFIVFYNKSEKIINKTSFIKTKMCDPCCSGLIVEISDKKHGNDKKVYEEYIKDPIFPAFDNLVKQYGFVMDKHSPWRLTFDLAGANATEYLKKYNVTGTEEYFDQFYYHTDYFNFENLKINLINLYNFIVKEKETVRNIKTKTVNGKICISEILTTRKFVTLDDIDTVISNREMMELYFYTICLENNMISRESQYDQIFDEFYSIKTYVGDFQAFDFLNNKVKELKDTGKSTYTKSFF
jgi:hypothetical protein